MSPSNSKLGQHQPLLEVPDEEASWSVGAEAILIVDYEYYKGSTKQNRYTVKLFLDTLTHHPPQIQLSFLCEPHCKITASLVHQSF